MHIVSEINDNCLFLKESKYPGKVPSIKKCIEYMCVL